jgi:ATP-dependent RNA helicase SUPV3L1/SUV3
MTSETVRTPAAPPAASTAPAPKAAKAPPGLKLPHARHLGRIPAGISEADVLRIQQAAYQLPQVVKPADYLDESAPHFEQHLDTLGLIQLQRAAAGARPSRWIAPERMADALRHLDAVGTGPQVRSQMLGRTAQLDGMGVQRAAGDFDRLLRQTLTLSRTPAARWKLDVAYRVPVPHDIVWDFYRTGDVAAFEHALAPGPAWPHAAAFKEHLEALVARAASGHPTHLASLLPRLQAECALPQPFDNLRAACTRTQDRWERHVAELDTLDSLNTELAFQGYPDSFELARRMQRSVTLYVGPPNSGKTHAAFERLAQAQDGAYLAPLRLLALEGRDRLVARGVHCSLLTGEENDRDPEAHLVSSTIEMVNTGAPIEVAVIDEAQMLFDSSRGWAWTQAIVGVPANELVIICSAYAVPAIENLLKLCGENCTIRTFERKQHVELMPGPVAIGSLKKGDAVVAFSRREVLMLRDQVAADGHPVSVIYGALPPEVRRREAERFAHGHAHILIATDAIGMGLNLPIRRVLFSTMKKFDGQADRTLTESEVHQIAGRAGRYGMHEEGFAGVLREAEPTAGRTLKELLPRPPRAPRDFKASVAPNWWHVDTIATRLQLTKLRAVLDVFVDQLRLDDSHFAVAELEQMLELAASLDETASKLSLRQRFTYAQAPVDTRTNDQVQAYLEWAWNHARSGQAGTPRFLDEVDEHSRLDAMESALRSCTLWLWLDLRFPGAYGHVDAVLDLRERLNEGIERHLKGKKPLWQRRGRR